MAVLGGDAFSMTTIMVVLVWNFHDLEKCTEYQQGIKIIDGHHISSTGDHSKVWDSFDLSTRGRRQRGPGDCDPMTLDLIHNMFSNFRIITMF